MATWIMKLAAEEAEGRDCWEGRERRKNTFLSECDKFPAAACVTISHNQINSMDPYLPAGGKKETEPLSPP